MKVIITDDFDLRKIAISGQCFRVKHLDNDYRRFICRDEVCYIKSLPGEHEYDVICSPTPGIRSGLCISIWTGIIRRYARAF